MALEAIEQALKEAELLKVKLQRLEDVANDDDSWLWITQLRKIYQRILILDLEYALDLKLEQDLWNLGFKNFINALQSQSKDKKNPKRSEAAVTLRWSLEAASGFYITLLHEICSAFELDLPCRRKSLIYGVTTTWNMPKILKKPHKSSTLYICQYCLVHLGDIARYQNRMKQAELFYQHAVCSSPNSGQPYNQLALLEASRGDKIGSLFYYIRSIAVQSPFPVAYINLSKILSSALKDRSVDHNKKSKLTAQEYITIFLKLHGLLHDLQDLNVALSHAQQLMDNLIALVATESFNSWKLVQMLVINIYTFYRIDEVTVENISSEDLTACRKVAKSCVLDLIASGLSTSLLPVYTIKNSLLTFFAMPTIKLCLEWVNQEKEILKEKAFASRLQIWPSLCVLLNGLQINLKDQTYDEHSKLPLPEDRNLQGFLPLKNCIKKLKFNDLGFEEEEDVELINKLRAARIVHLGRKIAEFQVNGSCLITLDDETFTSVIKEPEMQSGLIEDLAKLGQEKKKQPAAEGLKSIQKSTAETTADAKSLLQRNPVTGQSPSIRKPRQNIAMQAILRQAENEQQKQVTFKSDDLPETSIPEQPKPPNSFDTKNLRQALPNYPVHEILPGVVMSQASYLPLPSHQPPANSTVDFQFANNNKNNSSYGQIVIPDSPQQPQRPFGFPDQVASLNNQYHYFPYNNYERNDLNTWKNSSPPQQLASWWSHRTNVLSNGTGPPGVGFSQKWANPQQTVGNNPSAQNMRNGPALGAVGAMPPNFLMASQQQQHHQPPHALIGNRLENQFGQKPLRMQPGQDTYSLFSDNSWSLGHQIPNLPNEEQQMKLRLHQQSQLWSGSGPSPLERLLEQQKSLREGGT